MNTQSRATREYDGKKFGRFEQVPRHGTRHDRKARQKKEDRGHHLNDHRIGTVPNIHKKKGE
jgi:hypothetical protein